MVRGLTRSRAGGNRICRKDRMGWIGDVTLSDDCVSSSFVLLWTTVRSGYEMGSRAHAKSAHAMWSREIIHGI